MPKYFLLILVMIKFSVYYTFSIMNSQPTLFCFYNTHIYRSISRSILQFRMGLF